MPDLALIAKIEALLGPKNGSPGILHRHGRVLMSSWDSVRPSPYYFLGINPGGKTLDPAPPSETIGASLREDRASDWNYFSDAEAANPHQERMKKVFDALGTTPGRTPCSNLVFLRSADVNALPPDAYEVWRTYCAPVQAELLKTIRPKVLVCFGGQAWDWLIGRDPGHWDFHPSKKLNVGGFDHTCGVLRLPHFSGQADPAWAENAPALLQAMQDARALFETSNTVT